MKSKKYLLIMRHAESRHILGKKDFDRPLSSRGRQEAQLMAQKLNELKIDIKKLLVSDSLRTKETYRSLAEIFSGCPKPLFEHELYHASLEEMLEVLKNAGDQSLMLIAHNPGVSVLSEYLTGQYEDFSPGSLAILSTDLNMIEALKPQGFFLEYFLSPRSL